MSADSPHSRAVLLVLGRGVNPFPSVDFARLAVAFDEPEATKLATYVEDVLAALNSFEVDRSRHTLVAGTDAAVESIALRYPELSDEALDGLGWKFSYDWK